MERKYTINKKLAVLLISRIREEDLPITVHVGNERIDVNGDRLVDVLLDYEDPSLMNDVLSDLINNDWI